MTSIDRRSLLRAGLAGVAHVPGRMEPVDEGQPFDVFVDYAHTPDALIHALQALRPHASGRLVTSS